MSHGGIMQPLYVILNHYWTSINHLLIFIGEDIWFYTPWYHSSLCAPASSRFSSGSLWNGGVIVHFMFVQVQVGPLGDSDSLYGDIVSNTGVNASFCDRMIIYGVTNGNLRWRSFHIWHTHTLKGIGVRVAKLSPICRHVSILRLWRGGHKNQKILERHTWKPCMVPLSYHAL